MSASKQTQEGFRERVSLFRALRDSATDDDAKVKKQYPRKQVASDDILDAFVAALVASQELSSLQTLPEPPAHDSYGLSMEMVYAE